MAPELVEAAVPEFPGAARISSWRRRCPRARVRLERRSGAGHGRGRAGRKPGVRYLAVPVARDDRGGLVVDELPSFVPAAPVGAVTPPSSSR